MGLLDVFLKPYFEEGQPDRKVTSPADQFVDKVAKSLSTTPKNGQQIEFDMKTEVNKPGRMDASPQETICVDLRKPHESTEERGEVQNVDIVACVRENESAILTSLLSNFCKKNHSAPPSVNPLARASNIVNKIPSCDSCPACGHWDGYDRWQLGPGRYCFFSAVFKGKTARPVPIAEAQKACQKVNEPDLNGN